jgi:CspA family cold shock protein
MPFPAPVMRMICFIVGICIKCFILVCAITLKQLLPIALTDEIFYIKSVKNSLRDVFLLTVSIGDVMAKSKVKWFDSKKGYGFILNPEGGEDIFVHFSAIISDQSFKVLNQDSEVEYELDKTQKGLQARNVHELSMIASSITAQGAPIQGEFKPLHN